MQSTWPTFYESNERITAIRNPLLLGFLSPQGASSINLNLSTNNNVMLCAASMMFRFR
jgi:hypothetical protein